LGPREDGESLLLAGLLAAAGYQAPPTARTAASSGGMIRRAGDSWTDPP
jgi:hypothetical protein